MPDSRTKSSISTEPQPLRVLLVDDSEDELLLLDNELRNGGYAPDILRVDTEEEMEQALCERAWDLLIVDYVMPRFSAPAALDLYNRLELDLPIIVVSGKMGEQTAVETMRLGAHDYIVKQHRERLLPAIARELDDYQQRVARRRAEMALEETQAKLAVIAQSAQDAIVMVDHKGRIEFWNPAAERIFGYRADDVIGLDVHRVLAPDDRVESAYEGLAQFLETGEGPVVGTTIELPAKHKDGHTFPVELSISSFKSNGSWCAIAIVRDISKRKAMDKALKNLATHDALTNFFNRAELEKRLNEEANRALRYNRPLSIFFLDLDHFKSFNDNYGHQVGDNLLRELSDVLRREVRHIDQIGRYGGEEFVVILPETPAYLAMELAERLRKKVASHTLHIEGDGDIKITVSIGVGALPDHGETADALINAADSAMYAAKQAGRNQVRIASPLRPHTNTLPG